MSAVANRISTTFQITITRRNLPAIVKNVSELQTALAYKEALGDGLKKKPPEATFQVQRVGVRGGFSRVTKKELETANTEVTTEMVRVAKRELSLVHKH